jgi:hypothetical protein
LSGYYRLYGIARAFGPPTNFEGSHSSLYRTEGDGTVSDISELAGIQIVNPSTGTPTGKALGVAPIDFDRDGNATGTRGIDAALYRNDHQLGFFMGNFAGEMPSMCASQLASLFVDEVIVAGSGAATRLVLTFGLFLFGADLDGRLDLLQTNGHLEEDINTVQLNHRQSTQLFWNADPESQVVFVPIETARTADLACPSVRRGAAYADIDGDGDQDVILTQVGVQPLLLRNDQTLVHHCLRTKLVGRVDNRDAVSAGIELNAGGITQRHQVMPTRSSLSQVELPVTFEVGRTDRIDSILIIDQPENGED